MNPVQRLIDCVIKLVIMALCVIGPGCMPQNKGFVKAPTHTVTFHTEAGMSMLGVELARTEAERSKGLMFRTSLAKNSGMLFVFPDEQIRTFWMKNTYISLDLLFLDSQPKVVGIISHTEPMTLTPLQAFVPARYVVETPAGFAAQQRIHVGTQVTLSTGI